jgi:RNA polymerase sigma-70 factor (ECF subfamily)
MIHQGSPGPLDSEPGPDPDPAASPAPPESPAAADPGAGESPSSARDIDETLLLLRHVRNGDSGALSHLLEQYLPQLRAWASGRLPPDARRLVDTDDLVQETLVRSLDRVRSFELHHEGALQGYLRKVVLNQVRDHARRLKRAPAPADLDGEEPDRAPSPLDEVVGSELAERYEAAFNNLKPRDQRAIVLRMDLEYSYEDLAAALDIPSAGAARVVVSRALARLGRLMAEGPGRDPIAPV